MWHTPPSMASLSFSCLEYWECNLLIAKLRTSSFHPSEMQSVTKFCLDFWTSIKFFLCAKAHSQIRYLPIIPPSEPAKLSLYKQGIFYKCFFPSAWAKWQTENTQLPFGISLCPRTLLVLMPQHHMTARDYVTDPMKILRTKRLGFAMTQRWGHENVHNSAVT